MFLLSYDWWLSKQGKEVCSKVEWETPIMLCACPVGDAMCPLPSPQPLASVHSLRIGPLTWLQNNSVVWLTLGLFKVMCFSSQPKVGDHFTCWPLRVPPFPPPPEAFTFLPFNSLMRVSLLECDGEELYLLPVSLKLELARFLNTGIWQVSREVSRTLTATVMGESN